MKNNYISNIINMVKYNIKTAYVMSIAIGNITELKYADIFSVESSNITKSQVNKVHNAGREILA